MDLSIVIINYNSIDYTLGCLRSIYTHTIDLTFEVIVVDNASENDPENALRAEFPNIIYVRSSVNLGFAKGNNLGISRSSGQTILLLNNDTLVNEKSILLPYEFLNTNQHVGVITVQLRYPDGRVQHNCQSFPSALKTWIEKLRLHKLMPAKFRSKFMQGFYFDYTSKGNPDWIWGTYFMFKRELLDRLQDGKLNDDYFMYIEDMQWCWDIRHLGLEICYMPDAYIIHFGGGSGGDISKLMMESMKIFERNKLEQRKRKR